jgi:hypothetical protein
MSAQLQLQRMIFDITPARLACDFARICCVWQFNRQQASLRTYGSAALTSSSAACKAPTALFPYRGMRISSNEFTGPVAQWMKYRPTERGIAGSSPAKVFVILCNVPGRAGVYANACNAKKSFAGCLGTVLAQNRQGFHSSVG